MAECHLLMWLHHYKKHLQIAACLWLILNAENINQQSFKLKKTNLKKNPFGRQREKSILIGCEIVTSLIL